MPVADRGDWLSGAEAGVCYLRDNAECSQTLIYASMPAAYVCSVLAPTAALTPPDVDDLLRAYFTSDETWVIQRSYGGGEEHRVYLEPPMTHPGCNSLVGSDPFIFRRTFHGMKDFKSPIELNQKVVHSLGLFYMPERKAYCRLDKRGDIEDIISLIEEEATAPSETRTAVFIMSSVLAEYISLNNQVIYRKFDFTRVVPDSFSDWSDPERTAVRDPTLFYNTGVVPEHASFANGGQILRTDVTVGSLVDRWKAELDGRNLQYEIFKIFDRKNDCLVECSSSPEHRDSYFVKSDKPWDVSPVFFRPEVLARYKADPLKYDINERSIGCRNAWHLKTYDINEAGQVHTYLCYLADLPHEEQQYWKIFNEWPKSAISKRAFENDILGEFTSDREPLPAIKVIVANFDKRAPSWWKRRGDALAARVLIPATDSEKEWADAILALDQLIVEGFLTTKLRAVATAVGLALDPTWQSLRILEAVLGGLGASDEQASATMAPLRYLHHLRSKVTGHATGESKGLVREALTEHRTFRAHFTALCDCCDRSLVFIDRVLASVD